jgi:hypothetical protein
MLYEILLRKFEKLEYLFFAYILIKYKTRNFVDNMLKLLEQILQYLFEKLNIFINND